MSAKIADVMEQTAAEKRNQALIFSILLVLMTPGFLVIAAVIIAFVIIIQAPDSFGYVGFTVTGLNVFLGVMFVVTLIQPSSNEKDMAGASSGWIGVAALAFAALLGLSYVGNFREAHAGLFWTIYCFGMIAVLGLLGHAYVPRSHYYLGLAGLPIDNPFTVRDDIDRAHVGMGIAAAVPAAILTAYGELFASSWLWKPPPREDFESAAAFLQAASARDAAAMQEVMRVAGPSARKRMAFLLGRLELLRITAGRLEVTMDGRSLLARAQ